MNIVREKQRLLLLNRNEKFENKLNIFDNLLIQTHAQFSPSESTTDTDDDNVCIVWLTNDTTNDVELFDTISTKMFHSKDDCVTFIDKLQTTNVFLIIDYAFVSDTLSIFDEKSSIVFVYVLTNELNSIDPILTNATRSIRRLSNNKDELFRLIIKDIDTCVKDSICKDLMDLTEIEESTSQIKHASIVWYPELIECLSNLNFNDSNAKADLIEYCRQMYTAEDIVKQNQITQFEKEYSPENAIQYYTHDSFLFQLLNKTLRTRNIRQIFQFRYYIIDFQKQLESHFNQENISHYETVYRGQQITSIELMKLKKCVGKYISVNTYVSTSLDEQVALMFAGQGESGILSIVFQIDIRNARNIIDRRRVPVSVGHLSQFHDECEIIFPISSTFFVTSIQLIDKRWHMKLKLTDDNDHKQLIDSMKDDPIEQIPLNIQFIELYIASNDLNKSELYVQSLIEDLKSSSDSVNIAYICNVMGQSCSNRSYTQRALYYFEKACLYTPSESKYRAQIYKNIANEYINLCEHNTARKYLNQALEYKEQLDPFELISLYETLSILYREMADFDNAIISINQALDIHRVNRSSSKNLISAITYLGWIHTKKGDFKKALLCYKHALNIALKYISKDNSVLITFYTMIGSSYLECNDLSLAMTYLQTSLNLNLKDCPPIQSIFIYHTLAEIYNLSNDIEQTRGYAKKAFDIYNQNQDIIPEKYALVLQIHLNWARINAQLYNYNLALTLYVRTLKLTENNQNRILIYSEMGKIYLEKCQTNIALRYFNHSLRLIFQTGQSYLYNIWISKNYHNISEVYQRENNLEKAIFYVKLAFQLQFISENKNFDMIATLHYDLEELCPKQMNKYIEKIQEMLNRPTLSNDDQRSCHRILGNYYEKQENFCQALVHYELHLKYTLRSIPISYEDLINIYQTIGKLHLQINQDEVDNALLYYEKVHEIYLKLSVMEKLPIKDKYSMFRGEKYFLKNVNQSSSLNLCMTNIYYSLVKCYIQKKKLKQAFAYLRISEKIVNEYCGDNPAIMSHIVYFNIGFKYKFFNCYRKAIDCFEKRLQYLEDNYDYDRCGYTYYLIADCYESINDYDTALENYKISLIFLHHSKEIDYETLSECYRCVANLHKKLNNYECTTLKYFEQALLYQLKSNRINFNKHVFTRLEYVSALMDLKPWDFYEQLKYSLQGLQFTRYLDDHALVLLYQHIATLYLKNEMFHDTLFYVDKILQYNTQLYDILPILEMKIGIFLSTGDFERALEMSREKINVCRNFQTIDHIKLSSSYIIRAGIYRQLGKYKRAFKYCQFASTILQIYNEKPNHINYADIYEQLALIYLEYGQIKEARDYCWKARLIHFSQTNNTYDPILNSIILGSIKCKSGKYYDALNYFGRAWESIFNKDSVNLFKKILYNHIGYVYFKLGQADQAMKFYMKSLSLYHKPNCNKHPDIAQIYRNIGLFYEQIEQNYLSALSYYKRALELVPNKKHPHYIRYKSLIVTLKFKIQKEAHNMCSLF